MYYALSFLAAVIISVMIFINGELTTLYDMYVATVIIHIVGLVLMTAISLAKRERLFVRRRLPLPMYLGGLIGVATTLFNNMAFGKISVTAIVALNLLGQALTALIIDQFGFFDLPVKKFDKAKLAGLLFASFGIACMLAGSKMAILPVILSLLSGVSVVISRYVNANLAYKTSTAVSTWFNYVVGLIFAALVLGIAILCGMDANFSGAFAPRGLWIYTGGALGAASVALSNIVADKMPAFKLTLVLFAGQIFSSLALDGLLLNAFSLPTLMGGVFAIIGLSLNAWLDYRSGKKADTPAAHKADPAAGDTAEPDKEQFKQAPTDSPAESGMEEPH